MSRRLKQVLVAVVVVFVAAQLIRPNHTNPATDPTRTIQAQPGTPSALGAVLNRSCRDCHTNGTVWPSYAQVAPLSWLMASAVKKGRNAVNFSEWAGYPPDVQRRLLAESCADVSSGKMPGVYTRLQPETQLSAQDIGIICSATGREASK